MIIEQAFFALPEIVFGNGYVSDKNEAGVVASFSHAILQELNGHNVANPISLMTLEKRYSSCGFNNPAEPAKRPRNPRCDLHISTSQLFTGSKSLSDYGWRHSNWIEVKNFNSINQGAKTQNVASIFIDLIRLSTLIPFEKSDKDDNKCRTGRYFLHLHKLTKGEVDTVAFKGARKRDWLVKLVKCEGDQNLELCASDEMVKAFRSRIPDELLELRLNLSVTNLMISPVTQKDSEKMKFVLTRLNGVKVTLGDSFWEEDALRNFSETPKGSRNMISNKVGWNLDLNKKEDLIEPMPEEQERDVELNKIKE